MCYHIAVILSCCDVSSYKGLSCCDVLSYSKGLSCCDVLSYSSDTELL